MTTAMVRPALGALTSADDGEVVMASQNPILDIMRSMKATPETAEAIEKLSKVAIEWDDRNARKEFAAAFAQLQAQMPKVRAERPVMDRDKVRYLFASHADIMEQVQPLLTKHGFSVRFTSRVEDKGGKDRIIVICKLMHVGGHTEENECAMRLSGPPGTSNAQADGSTDTYAKRYALCNALGISIAKDNDARTDGDEISGELAANLRRRVQAVGADEARFLKFAQADSYETIREARVDEIERFLSGKELLSNKRPATTPSTVAGAQSEADRIRKEQDAAAEAPHQVPVDSAEEENREIVARERAETIADNAVTSGGKVLQDAFRDIPPAVLQTIINEHKFPPFKDRTKDQNRELLIMCQLEIIKKGNP